MQEKTEKFIFREVAGVWQRVDSQEPKPQILADFLKQNEIIIDNGCEFCRIRQYFDENYYIFTYKKYGGKITIIKGTYGYS